MTKMEVVAGIITELDKCFSSLTVSVRIRYHQHHLLFLKRKTNRLIQRVTFSCFKPGGDRLYEAHVNPGKFLLKSVAVHPKNWEEKASGLF